MEEYLNIMKADLIKYIKENPATMITMFACIGVIGSQIYNRIRKGRLDKKGKINRLENDLRA